MRRSHVEAHSKIAAWINSSSHIGLVRTASSSLAGDDRRCREHDECPINCDCHKCCIKLSLNVSLLEHGIHSFLLSSGMASTTSQCPTASWHTKKCTITKKPCSSRQPLRVAYLHLASHHSTECGFDSYLPQILPCHSTQVLQDDGHVCVMVP